ncbi:tetratricopeptide repeat protein [Compostibacter hankyongensis]
MNENQFSDEFHSLNELIQQYENLRDGRAHAFLDEDSFEQIIDYYDDQDQLQYAIQAAEYGIEQFPYCSLLLLKKANLLIETRHYQDALGILERVEALDPMDINLHVLKADVYLGMNQHEKAIKLLETQALRFEGEDRTDLLLELADVYDDCEEFDKVFDCLKRVLEHEPGNEEALHKICFWTEFTGRAEESIRLHKAIIDEHPYTELAWFNLGTAYQGLKLYEKAIDAYQYAIAVNDKFEYAYRNMADAYMRIRKYPEAIETLQRHLEIARPEDVIYEALGHCYEKQKKYDQARYYFRKAYHLNPDDERLYYRIASTFMQEENWPAAVKYLQTAHKINVLSLEYVLALCECFIQQEQYKDALTHLLEGVRLHPASVRVRSCLVRCLFLAGFYEEGEVQLDRARKATGDKPVYQYYHCALLLASGRTKEGLLQLDLALSAAPRQVKKLITLYPAALQHKGVIDLIARHKHNR